MTRNLAEEMTRALTELHLSTMQAQYEEVSRQATAETWGYADYLLELAQRECQQRREKRTERVLKRSKLPLAKSWGALDLKRLPTKVVQQLRSLLSGDFLDRRENVLVFGPPGSGKTHCLAGVAQELVRSGRRVWFTTCNLLVQDLLAAKRDFTLKAMKSVWILGGGDPGRSGLRAADREEMEVLFTFLAERYERGSVLLTSNLAFSKWEQIFKDPMTTAAAVDRLVHHSVIVELNIPSYRAESAKRSKATEG